VRVKRYSGKIFDDDLDVEWFAPVGMVPRGGDTKPRFDGTDEWIVSSDSVVDASDPDPERWVARYRATEAYVQQYTLVAKFDMSVQFIEVGLAMMVEGLTLVGKLVQDVVTKEYQFGDGTIVARIPAKRFVEFIPFAGTRLLGLPPICANDPQYFVYKETLCAANDVLLSGGVDPEAQCDAWSVMLRLVTTRAQLGGVEDAPNYDDLCPADLSPVLDSCETQYGPFSPP